MDADEEDKEESSDVSEEMFFDPPEFPPLHFPRVAGIGKGWGPAPYPNETAMLQGSRDFVDAIKRKQWAKVNELLKRQVDLDFQNDEGEAPLHLAIAARHEQLVRFLVSYPNHERGDTVDIDAVTDEGKTPLHYACAHDSLRLVAILLRCGANVHRITKTDGENALHMAAHYGNTRIARRLIRRGIDFTCKAEVWGTPLECAKREGNEEMVELLEGCIERQARMLQEHMDQMRAEQLAQQQSYYGGWGGWDTNKRSIKQPTSGWMWSGNQWVSVSAPATKRRITFMDTGWGEDGDEEMDDGLNYCNSVKCECCDSAQHQSRTFCSECGYVLEDTCPGCGVHNLDFDAECNLCGQILWAEVDGQGEEDDERPADPYYEPTGYEEYGDYTGYERQQEPCMFEDEQQQDDEEEWDAGYHPGYEEEDDWGQPVFYPEWMKKSD